MDLRTIEPAVHHTVSQKALLAAQDYPEISAEALAARFGISPAIVISASRVLEECGEDIISKIMLDDMSVSKAYRTLVVNGY